MAGVSCMLPRPRLSLRCLPELYKDVPGKKRKVSSMKKRAAARSATLPSRTSLVLDTPVVEELRTSFMSYALSVIVARALPDARDGLKPVHRRILFSLYSQNIKPTGPYKKSARVVGDTMARYHPHGDSAIYESLVRLAQDFSMRVPLVDPHGNFGSLDDSPAASRYTECRLAPAGLSMLDLLDEDTVDFVENYDGTEKEPAVLPASFPNLLVNGSTGVAVGMATNIPPHNLAEVSAAAAFMLRNKKATLRDLLRFVPGPDFPSGGEILDLNVLNDMYMTGRGLFTVRAKATIVDLSSRKKGIEITELPYTVGPEKVVARIRELIGEKKLAGISDARDLSDRTTGLRLVIEVKNGFDPLAVLSELYRLTPMQESFAASFVALIDGRPRVCSLYDLLKSFVDHRLEVLRRSTSYRLTKATARAHLLTGLVLALASIDEVVSLIRSSKDTDSAKAKLMKSLALDSIQATYVLDMPLRRLTSLEVSKVKEELAALKTEMKNLKRLLDSEKLLAEKAASELEATAALYATPRRTALAPTIKNLPQVTTASNQASSPASLEEMTSEPRRVALTAAGSLGVFLDPLGRARATAHDVALASLVLPANSAFAAVSASGQLTVVNVSDLAPLARGAKGISAASQADPSSQVVALVALDTDVVLFSRRGVVKRLPAVELRSGRIMNLDEDDELVAAASCPESDGWVVMVSKSGQVLRFALSSLRPQKRPASGVAGLNLTAGDEVLTGFCVGTKDVDRSLLLALSSGSVKATKLSEYPAKGRATSGLRACRFLAGEDKILAAALEPATPFTATFTGLASPAPSRRDASATKHDAPVALFGLLRP
jgi:DNA gyrase subunit A